MIIYLCIKFESNTLHGPDRMDSGDIICRPLKMAWEVGGVEIKKSRWYWDKIHVFQLNIQTSTCRSKQTVRPRSNCFYRSSLIRGYTVCKFIGSFKNI